MLAHLHPDKEIIEIREKDSEGNETRMLNSPLFKRFVGAIGYFDPAGSDSYAENWLVVIGEEEDGNYMVWTESFGSLLQIAETATNLKDQLLVERYYVSDEDPAMARALREYDGLTRYMADGVNIRGTTLWHHREDHWPHFRDRHTTASIVPVSTKIRADLMSGYEMIRKLDSAEKFTVRWQCTKTVELLRQGPPFNRIVNHPLMQALIFAFVMLERTKTKEKDETEQLPRRNMAYGNLRRGGEWTTRRERFRNG